MDVGYGHVAVCYLAAKPYSLTTESTVVLKALIPGSDAPEDLHRDYPK